MLKRSLAKASPWPTRAICLFCAARTPAPRSPIRLFNATAPLLKRRKFTAKAPVKATEDTDGASSVATPETVSTSAESGEQSPTEKKKETKKAATKKNASVKGTKSGRKTDSTVSPQKSSSTSEQDDTPKSLKEVLLAGKQSKDASKKHKKKMAEQLHIESMQPIDLDFKAVEVDIPPVPMLSYGLDRVLFNPGVYLLQDPRSRLYNFDPYLEMVMPVNEFNFEALSEYKTSSKDKDLINLTKRLGTKFTGSTSSMSGVLQHFHYLLSNFRELNHTMLSRGFPEKSRKFSKITHRPNAVFLRYKDGIYAIDADKSYDTPNIMSWLGHSLEKLLTTDRDEFELYRRSNQTKAPSEDSSSRCYHYSQLGNFLMRSQLDARDPRLPGSGVFDLKTRAVVSIRMNHKEYEAGSGYQLRFAQGQWESYEREFYDMTRATMLKYSLQVRMGRMDGIFVAYHNIERIFGFQYLSIADIDRVLHGQDDTALGDQEFKLSVGLLDELLTKAIAAFPETSIRLHVETRDAKTPFMYVFAEPVTEEQADEVQGAGDEAQKHFAQTVVGLAKDDPDVQKAWQSIQENVDEELDKETGERNEMENMEDDASTEDDAGSVAEALAEEGGEEPTTTDPIVETEPRNDGPLMGWTLTVRSKVNGGYVDRPEKLSKEDDWKLEYHIQEISQESRWRLYNAVKERRRGLSDMEGKEVDKGLQSYRDLIQRYSNRGREWRKEQDKLNEEMGVQVYKPLGPGSDAYTSRLATAKEESP